MRRLVLGIATALVLALVLTSRGAAAWSLFGSSCDKSLSNGSVSTSQSAVCSGRSDSSNPVTGNDGILAKVTNLLAWVGGIAAVFFIVVAGMQFILAGGESAKVATARNTILYASIGLVVIVAARILIIFVLNRF